MAFIKGTDAFGKVHWQNESGYWVDKTQRTNFPPAAAEQRRQNILRVNLYLDLDERVIPEIES